MLVLVKKAAEAIASSYLEAGDLVRIGDRRGDGFSWRAFAMPRWGRCTWETRSNSRRAWSGCG
ncbi:hypothetical protein ADK41_35850 [Streptomyces caelestis]|uniref:Uncharacterized protein n=1 Tax=Streptomyces caelestis TaxID=36816 RepID=A0A0M8QJ27_9ACTN|nr:hypothetical protein ADK41_35850 [Streptomyces caelestis]